MKKLLLLLLSFNVMHGMKQTTPKKAPVSAATAATIAKMAGNPVTFPLAVGAVVVIGIASGAKVAFDIYKDNQRFPKGCGNVDPVQKMVNSGKPIFYNDLPLHYEAESGQIGAEDWTEAEKKIFRAGRQKTAEQVNYCYAHKIPISDELNYRFHVITKAVDKRSMVKYASMADSYVQPSIRIEEEQKRMPTGCGDSSPSNEPKYYTSGGKKSSFKHTLHTFSIPLGKPRRTNTADDLATGMKDLKKDYQYDKSSGKYKLKPDGKPIEKDGKPVIYVAPDYTHNEIETYGKKKDLGPIDPITKEAIPNKPAVKDRSVKS